MLPIITLTALGHLADLGTTWYAITFSGAREANPILGWFVNSDFRGKWWALAGLKAIVVRNEAQVCFRYRQHVSIGYIKALLISCAFVWVVVGWNLGVILRRKYHAGTSSKA